MPWKGAWAAGVRPTPAREALSALCAAAAVGLTTGLCATALAARMNPSLRDARDATWFLLSGASAYVALFLPLGLIGLVFVRSIGFLPRIAPAPEEPAAQAGGAPAKALNPATDPRAAEARSRFPFSTHAAVMLSGVAGYGLAMAVGPRYVGDFEDGPSLLWVACGVALAGILLAAYVATRRIFQGLIGPRRWLIPIVLLFLSGLFLLLGVGGGEIEAHRRAPELEILGAPERAPDRLTAELAALPAPTPQRVVLLALDGADWERIDALMALGELPSFRRLLARGVRTSLRGEAPAWAPVAWTTVATGVPPARHGVRDLTEVRVSGLSRGLQRLYARGGEPPLLPPGLGLRPLAVGLLDRLLEAGLVEERLVSSEQRRSKAVWNILSERGLPVAVVRWPASRPAESLYGWVVAEDERGAEELRRPGQGSARPDEAGLFSPEELREELDDLLQSRSSGEGLGPGGSVPLPRPSRAGEGAGGQPPGPPPLPIFEKLSADGLAVLEGEPGLRVEARGMLAADAFGSRAALRLWRERRPKFLALYLRSLDHLGHRLARVPGAVEGTYRWMDEALGAWLEAVGDDATLVVVSAHGQPLAAGAHGREGILVLSGAGVRPGVEFAEAPSLYDVAPTLLALYGLPPAREMPGRALLEALEVSARPSASLRPGTYGSYSVRDVLPQGAAVAGAKAAQAVGD